MSFGSHFKELDSYSSTELEKLIKKAQFLVKFKSGKTDSSTDFVEEMLLQAATRYVQPIPLAVLRRVNPSNLGVKLHNIAEEVLSIADDWDLSQSKLVELCSIVMEIADSRLEKKGLSKDFRTMLYLLGSSVTVAIDQEFPGYLASGMFKQFILKD